jgi:hypothetical protein
VIRARLWCELVLGAISFVLTVVTLAWPTWFESLSGESPDGGDGSFERLFSLAWLAAAVLFTVLARRDHRRLKAA